MKTLGSSFKLTTLFLVFVLVLGNLTLKFDW